MLRRLLLTAVVVLVGIPACGGDDPCVDLRSQYEQGREDTANASNTNDAYSSWLVQASTSREAEEAGCDVSDWPEPVEIPAEFVPAG